MSCYVLFVDDEPENRAVFEASCADTFSVLVASGADEARALMQKHEVGVLVTDHVCPAPRASSFSSGPGSSTRKRCAC